MPLFIVVFFCLLQTQVETLHNLWLHLKQLLEGRIDLSAQYIEFHEKAVQLVEQLDSLENNLRDKESSQQIQQLLDDHWANLQQLFRDFKNMGHSFISEAEKVSSNVSTANTHSQQCIQVSVQSAVAKLRAEPALLSPRLTVQILLQFSTPSVPLTLFM